MEECQRQIKSVKTELAKDVKELNRWENLMLDSLEGTCIFTPEQVKKRMDTVQASIDELTQKMEMLQSKIEQSREQAEQFKMQHQQLLSWAEIFDSATVEEKKMISSYIIKAVTLSRNYQMRIEFNISEAQYLSGMEMG